MPRQPFCSGHLDVASATGVTVAFLALASLAAPALAAPPVPSITSAASTQGEAPFTVHVHGLASQLNAGDEATARYEWNFGDSSGAFNTLVGWNAAHTYDQPGVYTLTLRVTNANREQATRALQVTVNAPARSAIYVSPSGSDSNSGSSSSSPVRTVARANQLLGNNSNKAVYFQRGGVFDTTSGLSIGGQNVLIGAYGSGNEPVLHYSNSTAYSKVIQVGSSARDVVIENLNFDSPFVPDNNIVRGIEARGTNVTVRRCRFGDVSYAITSAGGVSGLLTSANIAGHIGAYYVWVEGSDHTHVGNVVAGSVYEHNIRLGGASRVLIAHNDLTNVGKSSVWCMLGDHCYVYGNKLRSGRMIAGPNFSVGDDAERFRFAAAEANEFFDAGVVLYDGAEEIVLRNNVFHDNGNDIISVWGYAPERNRTVRSVSVLNNTAINLSSQYGKFLKIGSGAQEILVANNLYDAPWLNGHSGGNVVCEDTGLFTHSSHHNIWAVPAVGPRYHGLADAVLSGWQWSSLPQVSADIHRDFGSSDLNSSFQPQFNAAVAAPVAGVFTDYFGNVRTASGTWHAGAVAGPPGQGGGGGNGADTNGDGDVDVDDLVAVVIDWGSCAGCSADTNDDGAVNVDDLVDVVLNWD